ncbi:hypothetical protein BGY98DRAFT_416025 [Russula aff. rugulosa BPL654]|nr:hypothetical protein BGY98DRAFT_416025 [Russula aff. rugulosa BPL654]
MEILSGVTWCQHKTSLSTTSTASSARIRITPSTLPLAPGMFPAFRDQWFSSAVLCWRLMRRAVMVKRTNAIAVVFRAVAPRGAQCGHTLHELNSLQTFSVNSSVSYPCSLQLADTREARKGARCCSVLQCRITHWSYHVAPIILLVNSARAHALCYLPCLLC